MSKTARPVVVIVGGGFGGLAVAKQLGRSDAEVIIVDRHNHHCFQPLLYQVATAALSATDIAEPIRHIVRHQKNASVVLGKVERVDLDEGRIVLDSGAVQPYDRLVLACGMTHSYFGNDEWAEHAPGLKSIDEALQIRRRMLLAFEEAELESDEAARRAKLTFVVVGGGPTGVELAGAIKEIAAQSIPRDFRYIDTTTTRVVLVEAADRLLQGMSEALGQRARRDLERMGVELQLGRPVSRVDESGVVIGEERVEAQNVLWAAGVRGVPLAESLGAPLDRAGRVKVEPDLSVSGHPDVFVVGDLACVIDPKSGEPVPGVAQGALQMGNFVGRRIRAELAGRQGAQAPFRYRDYGTMATIGRGKAVASILGFELKGWLAWLIWSLVHLVPLIGFRNRLGVMLSWIWDYVLFFKGARLITGDSEPDVSEH